MKLLQRKKELFENLEENINVFAFVHSVADKELYFQIDLVPREQYVNLLPVEEQDKLGEVTPYVVELKPEDEFTDWLLANEKLMKDAFFVHSKEGIKVYAEKFKHLIYCYDDEGKKFYFGFYTADIFSGYIGYLQQNEPAQCMGLLSGAERIFFHKRLMGKAMWAEFGDKAIYCPLTISNYTQEIKENPEPPSSYLAPAFFTYFAKLRADKYQEALYHKLMKQYPESKYSQGGFEVGKMMNEVTEAAKEYKITDEVAVENLIEAS